MCRNRTLPLVQLQSIKSGSPWIADLNLSEKPFPWLPLELPSTLISTRPVFSSFYMNTVELQEWNSPVFSPLYVFNRYPWSNYLPGDVGGATLWEQGPPVIWYVVVVCKVLILLTATILEGCSKSFEICTQTALSITRRPYHPHNLPRQICYYTQRAKVGPCFCTHNSHWLRATDTLQWDLSAA